VTGPDRQHELFRPPRGPGKDWPPKGARVQDGFGTDFHSTYFLDWLRFRGISDVEVARFPPNLMSAEVDANRRAAEQQARDAAARWCPPAVSPSNASVLTGRPAGPLRATRVVEPTGSANTIVASLRSAPLI
jgi:hypothetical protein